MTEEFIHYIWFHKFFDELQETVLHENVSIIDVGLPNPHTGPDVFNAKIKRGSTIWAGNVEFHIKASDWNKHHHSLDKHFNSVILHVVLINDTVVYNQRGECVPQLVLHFPNHLLKHYKLLEKGAPFIPCASHFKAIDPLLINVFLERLLIERLQNKTQKIQDRLIQYKGDWLKVFYMTLGHNFGFATNALPFELLVESIALPILLKHSNNLLQIEALLFGQAHLLPQKGKDSYTRKLIREYTFLAHKYQLHPIDEQLWRFLRLRPSNFPTIKIAQFAALIHHYKANSMNWKECQDLKQWDQWLDCEASSYWQSHYLFDKPSELRSKKLDKKSKQVIEINTIIPLVFCYAHLHENPVLQQSALELLEDIPAENNYITRGFNHLNINIESAYESQALIQLKTKYCDKRDCLRCTIGHEIYKIKI